MHVVCIRFVRYTYYTTTFTRRTAKEFKNLGAKARRAAEVATSRVRLLVFVWYSMVAAAAATAAYSIISLLLYLFYTVVVVVAVGGCHRRRA